MQKNKLLKFLYLFLIISGSLLFLVGVLFRYFHWPDMFQGISIGPIFLIIGLVILVYTKYKKRDYTI